MAEQKESSVLFSLKELMDLEQERISREEADRTRKAEELRTRREQEERATREKEAQRARDEEERRRAEAQRSREEAARLEAIKQAELERAKAEAEHRAQLEAVAAQRQHEAQLAAIAEQSKTKKLKVGVAAAFVLLAAIMIGLGFAYVQHQRDVEQQRIASEALRAQSEKLQQQLASEEELRRKFEQELSSVKDEVLKQQMVRDKIKAAQDNAPRSGASTGDRPKPATKPTTTPKRPETPCNCPPGDPLCSCL